MKFGKRTDIEATDEEFSGLIERLIEYDPGIPEEEIYPGRNRVTRIEYNGKAYAVKYFSRSLKNRLVYAIFKSKARRSYLYAKTLKRLGISTPEPIGYAERRGFLNTLQDSLYICAYEDAMPLKEYLERGEKTWKEFGDFVAELHEKGVIHKDLNNANVRVQEKEDGRPVFSLIDLNRMKFYDDSDRVTGDTAYKNLVRFSYLTPEFEAFALEYVKARNLAPTAYDSIMEAKRKHEKRK